MALIETEPLMTPADVAPEIAALGIFGPNRDAPFHRWVHLTEGFSAKLVTQELLSAPRDAYVYDPFGGTGTTPLVAAELGFRACWAEVNPYLREAAAVKVAAARQSSSQRKVIVSELKELLALGPDEQEDGEHPLARANALRDFFAPEIASVLLGWARRFAGAGGLTARLGALAVASCAIAASNMKRAVDLRRRTPSEMAAARPDASGAVRARVGLFVEDLISTPTAPGLAECVSDDARSLPEALDPIDLVVTSPPYLNGTNYCRNTKLELLLLRLIDSEAELRELRSRSITAGINNVSKRIRRPVEIDAVERVAAELDECAYDPRIPTMVRAYFSDMQTVLATTRNAASADARMVLGIGDSRFAGVYIDTPGLLGHIAEQAGWEVRDAEIIRARTAKDGNPLCQKLLRLCSA